MTPLHSSVISDRPDILELLLKQLTTDENVRRSLLLANEKEGRSLIHLAASLCTEKCLSLLLECASLDLDITDLHGHSVYQAASKACKDFLDLHDQERSRQVTLLVELKTQLEGATVSCTRIGTIEITPSTSWSHLEIQLQTTLADFLSQLDRGLRTRRLARFYRWSPCMQTEKQPFSIASNNNDKKAAIIIDDTNNLCELIAFDILHPVPILHSYLRLLSQYKSAVFYGPVHSGKSYLVQRLAQCLATEEKGFGRKPAIFKMSLTNKTSHEDLLAFLKQKGCLLPVEQQTPMSPILLLEDLELVSMATFFGELLDPLLQRGMQYAFSLTEDSKAGQLYYFPESFYLLGTLNRTRSTGIDLSIQQRFRWVQFRHDAEPLRNLLARHFLRRLYHLGDGKLPAFDDPLLQATEWIICVWQRLNDSLGKLGLPNVALGPCCFFKCPVEKRNPKVILQWVQDLWNSEVVPQVREAVKKGTGSETQGQQKGRQINKRTSGGTTAVQLAGRRVRHTNCSTEDSSSPPLQMDTQQNVEGSPSVVTAPSQNGTDRQEFGRPFEFFTGTNIKHRSLSESSVNKTLELLDDLDRQQGKHNQFQQTKQQILQNTDSFTTSSHQAKVPKLEMRSSRILSLSNSFKTLSRNNSGDDIGCCDEQGQAVKVNPLHVPVRPGAGQHLHHHNKHHAHKKSRSSENISPSGLFAGGMHQSVNPFSFSLSTPKSSLTSFKFFEKPSPLLSSQTSLSSPEASSLSSTASAMSLLQSLAPAFSSASPSASTYDAKGSAGSSFVINSENQSHTSPVIGTQSEFAETMNASQVPSRPRGDLVIEGCTREATES
ncbi:cortactin-binding protein 2-like [Pomacea canaliculata]|uniref:cortactin-binding protein 2-like n=1 Tax=Pomacea canaliculata TaxID=400727 RepID=UPI000D73CAAD|nr:cortactin-binding protein 2-like [Pomacea canaliculata]